jgi:hypothetical protein
VNDSDLDWNHALPDGESFVRQEKLNHVLLNEWGSASLPGAPRFAVFETWDMRLQQLRFQRSNELNPRHDLAHESFVVRQE